MSAALQWCADSFADVTVGFANSIKTIDGGSHMDGLRAALTRLVNGLAKKNKARRAPTRAHACARLCVPLPIKRWPLAQK